MAVPVPKGSGRSPLSQVAAKGPSARDTYREASASAARAWGVLLLRGAGSGLGERLRVQGEKM